MAPTQNNERREPIGKSRWREIFRQRSRPLRSSERKWRRLKIMKGESPSARADGARFSAKARRESAGILCVFQARSNAALAEKIRHQPQTMGLRLSKNNNGGKNG